MEFTLRKQKTAPGENGEPVVSFTTTTLTAELTQDGTFNVYQNDGPVIFKIVEQPWAFDSEGNRTAWDNIDEGIAWFKQNNGHVEE